MALTPGTRFGVLELISAAAAFFDTKANKLRAMGWRPDYGKLTGDTIAAAATYGRIDESSWATFLCRG